MRATCCALAVLAGMVVGAGPAAAATPAPPQPHPHLDPVDPTTPLDLVSVAFGQVGDAMRVRVVTAAAFHANVLDPRAGRSVCLLLRLGPAATRPTAQLCALYDATRTSRVALRLTQLGPDGKPAGFRAIKAPVLRPTGREIRADVPLTELQLAPGRYAWQARTRWRDATGPCIPPAGCTDVAPDGGAVLFRVRALQPVGCAFTGAQQVRHGPAGGKRVALTFDDGPAAITSQFLDLLEREKVPATFFVVGKEVSGRVALLRRMLADGDMIGNHTWDHANVSGGGSGAADEIARTQQVVRKATGFTPCLFRPPYGGTSSGLVATAGAQRLTTVIWDVDPTDWANPGADAIASRVLSAVRDGSIVLSHDGGGPRGGTLAAYEQIIPALKARGYTFVTVNDLLGLPVVLGPATP